MAFLQRGALIRLGQFDANGNFLPDPQYPAYRVGPSLPGITAYLATPGVLLPQYEHRSGRLIVGVGSRTGVFVPELGSKVLDLRKDYDPDAPDRIIYNFHDEAAAAYWTERRKREFPDGLPRVPEPPKASATTDSHEFLPFRAKWKTDPWFARVIGDVMELGHLSEDGEFVPDYGLPVFPYVKAKNPAVYTDGVPRGAPQSIYYTLPQNGKETEAVYEYRSGRLILGTLQSTGNFVPEIGSRILDFKTYNPDRDPRRIYNLPGTLKRKG